MQVRQLQRGCRHGLDGEIDTGMITAKCLDHRRQDRARDRLRTPDPYFTLAWIGKKLDIANALLQFIKGSNSAFEQRATIDRRDHALRCPIKQADGKRVFELSN